jgi:hypothetical protein
VISRIRTDQRWADVVVDLRANRSMPLPTRDFNGRRKAYVGNATISGTRRSNTHAHAVGILKWTDETGFTGAVVTLPGAGGEFAEMNLVLPHVAHLISDMPRSKHKNVTEPLERGEAAFAAAMPVLQRVLTETITEPVRGAVDSRMSMMYRLAWAAVGVEDVSTIPMSLRDWDRVQPVTGDGREYVANFPEDLTLRGSNLVAAWQKCGFTDASTVGAWVERLYPGIEQAQSATSQRRTSIEELATWESAGFAPDEVLDWFEAARYNPNSYAAGRFVPADYCAQLRERGITPEYLAYLTSGIGENTAQSAAIQHVKTWLNVSRDPVRVCWYIAAGIGKAEAKTMERSPERPDIEQLRLLAAFQSHGGPIDID